jgi:hypothetical protein
MFFCTYNKTNGRILGLSRVEEEGSQEISSEDYFTLMSDPNALTTYRISSVNNNNNNNNNKGKIVKRQPLTLSFNLLVPIESTSAGADFVLVVAPRSISLQINPVLTEDIDKVTIRGLMPGKLWSKVQTFIFRPGIFTLSSECDHSLLEYSWHVDHPVLKKTYSVIKRLN